MPPGHPIILLKSNQFNMATVSVKKVYFVNTQISAAALIKLFYVKVRRLIDHLRFAFS